MTRFEDRIRPVLIVSAWALAMPLGALTAAYYGHAAIGVFITLNALVLGWCDI